MTPHEHATQIFNKLFVSKTEWVHEDWPGWSAEVTSAIESTIQQAIADSALSGSVRAAGEYEVAGNPVTVVEVGTPGS